MRVLFLVILIALIGGGWWLARRGTAGDELVFTVVFSEPTGLRSGDPVVTSNDAIGRVREVSSSSGGGERVEVAVGGRFRGDARSDTVWRVDQRAGSASLVADNRVAVGPSLEEGAEVRGGSDPTKEWLARGRDWMGRISREAEDLWRRSDAASIERQFDEWTERMPEWKARGTEAVAAAREQVAARAREAERKLRESGRIEDADRLRDRLTQWLNETRDQVKQSGEERRAQ